MTRQEFDENISSWYDLLEFCRDAECPVCEDVYDEDDRNNEIDVWIEEYVCHHSWQDVKDKLCDIPEGYDYHRNDGDGDWVGLDDSDLDDYKDDVMSWMDNRGLWDEEEDEEEEEDEYEEEPPAPQYPEEEPLEPEDISLGELFTVCNSQLQCLEQKSNNDEDNIDEVFIEELEDFDELW